MLSLVVLLCVTNIYHNFSFEINKFSIKYIDYIINSKNFGIDKSLEVNIISNTPILS